MTIHDGKKMDFQCEDFSEIVLGTVKLFHIIFLVNLYYTYCLSFWGNLEEKAGFTLAEEVDGVSQAFGAEWGGGGEEDKHCSYCQERETGDSFLCCVEKLRGSMVVRSGGKKGGQTRADCMQTADCNVSGENKGGLQNLHKNTQKNYKSRKKKIHKT